MEVSSESKKKTGVTKDIKMLVFSELYNLQFHYKQKTKTFSKIFLKELVM
jgi:hypothetical protein